ncbi:MAG TPA: hypothetical protein H9799_07610 [Candidatus Mediterraneibacter merdipullorum]|nr:hypothetical protein [Candidatus Mediterraneibacter merdipullorum]
MGKADVAIRKWLSDKRRYADLFNGILFSGENIVSAEELEEQNNEMSALVTDQSGSERTEGKTSAAGRISVRFR